MRGGATTSRASAARGASAAGGLAFLLGLLAGALLGWRTGGPPDLSRWSSQLDRAAREAGVDRALLSALVAVESGGQPGARSGKGARGLLQLVPDTAREEAMRLGLGALDESALYEPSTNLRLGATHLARLLDRYRGSEAFAIAAYNAGGTPVGRWRRLAPHLSARGVVEREGYDETRRHVARVLAWVPAYR